MKKILIIVSLLLVFLVGGCASKGESTYANLSLSIDFYDSTKSEEVPVIIWGNYSYRITDQDLYDKKCDEIHAGEIVIVGHEACEDHVLKESTKKQIKANNIDTMDKLQSEIGTFYDTYKEDLKEYGVELERIEISLVKYANE